MQSGAPEPSVETGIAVKPFDVPLFRRLAGASQRYRLRRSDHVVEDHKRPGLRRGVRRRESHRHLAALPRRERLAALRFDGERRRRGLHLDYRREVRTLPARVLERDFLGLLAFPTTVPVPNDTLEG